MTFARIGFLAFILAALAGTALAADDPDAILGIWVTEQKEPGDSYSHIEVELRDGKYAGKIVWLSDPVYKEDDPEAGVTLHDRENPDESLRDRPLLGMDLMHGFRFNEKDGKWVDGKIYDPEAGKEYKCKVTMKDPDTLEVFGYIKVGFVKMGRDTIWKRVP